MKGVVEPGHIGVHQFELVVTPGPTLVFTEVSGMSSETTKVEMPDRTIVTGGEETVGEFTAMLPMHHESQINFMDLWLQEGRDPVSPLYKKLATMNFRNIEGSLLVAHELIGLFVSNKTLPDADMANDGELAKVEYAFNYDSLIRLP
ncbi:hypothetical protein LCGC14_0835740 [marine sediment metagenome]|uniref:Uncharacterized protein n=1 Tax=marine sediment metagenome TaxID=412755 RepID=A0A0F9PJB0_9ZZZZ